MILLAFSLKDAAGANIASRVLANYPFDKTSESFQGNPIYSASINCKSVMMIALENEAVFAQNLEEHFHGLELIVFLSRHSSASGSPTLSVHAPGNLGAAELGGLPKTLSVCPGNAMSVALRALDRLGRESSLNYEVSYECTHHGPSLSAPTMFVELGSTPIQWSDLKAAAIVAKASMEAVAAFGESRHDVVLGIGGPHYNRRFTQMALKGKTVFGHMIPKYALDSISSEMVRNCRDRTLETTEKAVLDWKGIKGEHKPKVLKALAEINLSYEKV